MNIQQLEYIVAVGKYRQFSKAAEACFVTQPSLSMMVQKLEEELDVQIFDRSQIPVQPTKIGEKIIEMSVEILQQINGIKRFVQDEKGMIKGVFRMGIIPTVSTYLLPKLMHLHSIGNSNLKIKVFELTTDHILEGLKNDSLDGAILATPLNEENIIEYPIYYEQFFAYVSPEEKRLYAQTSLNATELEHVQLWLLDEVHCFRTQILHLCNMRDRRKQPKSIFEYRAGNIDTLINIVDRSGGATVIPEMALDNLGEEQKKNVRPFRNSTPVREIGLITNRYFLKERMVEAVIEEIQAAVPKSMQDKAMKKYVVPI